MRKVLLYSLLLIAGLVGSQFRAPGELLALKLATMVFLSFIMIHVGLEFEIDKSRPGHYAWDAFVATSAAALPWLFCAGYFVFVLSPRAVWSTTSIWKGSLLEGLFAAPTSAGVLFSMLAAAGLASTWVFKKARVLAVFDDLATLLLLVPLKAMLIGPRWQLLVVVAFIVVLLWLAWTFLRRLPIPAAWPWVLGYAGGVTVLCELIFVASARLDARVPIQLEVLLPAFALGCMIRQPKSRDTHDESSHNASERHAATIVSGAFMVLVGLSMPPVRATSTASAFPGWPIIAAHVLAITLLSNLGKFLPALCYRREASRRERLALAIGMFPRGEVGAGVLVIALSYGMAGTALTVAVLSLALNLICTGLLILIVRRLLGGSHLIESTNRQLSS